MRNYEIHMKFDTPQNVRKLKYDIIIIEWSGILLAARVSELFSSGSQAPALPEVP